MCSYYSTNPMRHLSLTKYNQTAKDLHKTQHCAKDLSHPLLSLYFAFKQPNFLISVLEAF